MEKYKMAKLVEITSFLDKYLNLETFKDDSSNNGLQVEASEEITKAVFAVDGCQASIDFAVKEKAQLLFVHHGLSWGAYPKRFDGIHARRFGTLFRNGVSLYAAHLPLDGHPEVGNNAVLADIIGLQERKGFFFYDGDYIGVQGSIAEPVTVAAAAEKISSVIGGKPAILGDPERKVSRICIVSGGGGSQSVNLCAAAGCELVITGKLTHQMYHDAVEQEVSLIALGHYASETTGPRAVMKLLGEKFGIETVFADIPTGL